MLQGDLIYSERQQCALTSRTLTTEMNSKEYQIIRRNNMFNLSNMKKHVAANKAATCQNCNHVMPSGADYTSYRPNDSVVGGLIAVELCFNCMITGNTVPSRQ